MLIFLLFFSWSLPPFQATFLFSLIKYTPLTYNKKYVYPWWGDTLGWLLALSSMVCIPLWIVYKLSSIKGSLREVRLVLCDWGMGCVAMLKSSLARGSFVCCRFISREPRINQFNESIAITGLVFLKFCLLERLLQVGCGLLLPFAYCFCLFASTIRNKFIR